MQPKSNTVEETVKFATDAVEELNARLAQQQYPPFNNTPEEIVRRFFKDQGMFFEEEGIKQVIASVTGSTKTPAAQSTGGNE